MTDSTDVLTRLMRVIRQRRDAPSPESYTCRLFEAGIPRICEKISEESAEVVEAANEDGDEGRDHLVREAADLTYHLLVLLAARDADLENVENELASRFGISGLQEKASRQENTPVHEELGDAGIEE